MPRNEIVAVKYFTSEVESRAVDPDKLERQRTFIRALKATGVEVHYGKFTTKKRWLKLVKEPGNARVFVTNEKRSDVNLASHLLVDAFDDRFDVAAIVTSDSDLITPIAIVRERFGKDVVLLNPQRYKPDDDLIAAVANNLRTLRDGPLAACHLPDHMSDDEGAFEKPDGW